MNNLEYICAKHPDFVGAILEDLAAQDTETELALTLENIGFPDEAMRGCDSMMEWLDAEREPGAWRPGDCAADIVRDVNERGESPVDYLDERGIGYTDVTMEELCGIALKDVTLRWSALYASAVSGPIFEANLRNRIDTGR